MFHSWVSPIIMQRHVCTICGCTLCGCSKGAGPLFYESRNTHTHTWLYFHCGIKESTLSKPEKGGRGCDVQRGEKGGALCGGGVRGGVGLSMVRSQSRWLTVMPPLLSSFSLLNPFSLPTPSMAAQWVTEWGQLTAEQGGGPYTSTHPHPRACMQVSVSESTTSSSCQLH